MPPNKSYVLKVQNALEERQLRRLGAAVSLLWNGLPQAVQNDILLEASAVRISGETADADALRDQILQFLKSRTIGYS